MFSQMMIKSKTFYFPKGTIIADGRDPATGMMVITQGSVSVELPMDSDKAGAQGNDGSSTLLYTLGRGYDPQPSFFFKVHERLKELFFLLRMN